MTTIADLSEDRTVEGVFAVTKKERRRTRAGASYLALELADASGRVEARVWNDVDLLDGRFEEGDAVHVLGRGESFGGRPRRQGLTGITATQEDFSSTQSESQRFAARRRSSTRDCDSTSLLGQLSSTTSAGSQRWARARRSGRPTQAAPAA